MTLGPLLVRHFLSMSFPPFERSPPQREDNVETVRSQPAICCLATRPPVAIHSTKGNPCEAPSDPGAPETPPPSTCTEKLVFHAGGMGNAFYVALMGLVGGGRLVSVPL